MNQISRQLAAGDEIVTDLAELAKARAEAESRFRGGLFIAGSD